MDVNWNVLEDSTMKAAAYVAGVFCVLQKSPVDLGTYYDAQPSMTFCGIFDFHGPRKPFYAFKAFNCLYSLGSEVAVVSDIDKVNVCAALSDTQGAILLSNYDGENLDVTVEVAGLAAENGVRLEYYHLDETSNLKMNRSEIYNGDVLRPVVPLENNTVVLLKLIKL